MEHQAVHSFVFYAVLFIVVRPLSTAYFSLLAESVRILNKAKDRIASLDGSEFITVQESFHFDSIK